MEIYLVPFSLIDLVLLSPVYAYLAWYLMRRIMHKKRRFTGFMTWSFIIHATIIPFFWVLHYMGIWGFVEDEQTTFDPVKITGHIGGFMAIYALFCGGITIVLLMIVKRRSI